MSLNSKYDHFKINKLIEGPKSFFATQPAKHWSFINYFKLAHNDINKIKNYKRLLNDYIIDLEWITTLEEVPNEIKDYVIALKDEERPNRAEMKAAFSLPKKKRRINNNYSIKISNNGIIGDYNTVKLTEEKGKRTKDKETETEKEKKTKGKEMEIEKEKRMEEKEMETEKDDARSFWKDWANFLANNKSFHPFRDFISPEFRQKHVWGTLIDSSDVREYKKAIREVPTVEDNEEFAFDFLEAIFRAVYAFHTSRLDIKEGESTFNSLFIYPFLKAVADAVAMEMAGSRTDFLPGEVNLKAMSEQLKELGNIQDDRDRYMADGIVRLYGYKSLEVVLLETSRHFGCTDKAKICFDHHKGLFGLLAMLKSIADVYHEGTMKTFRCVKVFFVHAAEETLYLWSLRFEPEGPVYELWLEDMLLIRPDIEDKLEALPAFINFFWNFKCLLSESISNISQLKKENAAALVKSRFKAVEFGSLSSMINASILKLTEEEDKAGMSALGPFYSNPSSPC
ncbi:hypothetical protein G6F46_002079 [Rhizopus delemar]|uniref:Uncharacterized protein n=2 Tax=Rhizopus TaxID=4842 RepID=A0A9P6Z922_9FUNG|nr:hypothetical protein G6F36_010908 [Rhizopus arrhizus]KAG1463668.1 hypothetical protein G6F55_002254 [Rhizopus delemar]KAG1496517.1 hypothetical protein G6F54_006416 [Rhizopus delemar]KAG1516997.1 hypothetical protein G6F53_001731 [Rhizopus delemar]KAG1526505.1 hypothetical protein G6F52_002369 [Rhizopus delemar]